MDGSFQKLSNCLNSKIFGSLQKQTEPSHRISNKTLSSQEESVENEFIRHRVVQNLQTGDGDVESKRRERFGWKTCRIKELIVENFNFVISLTLEGEPIQLIIIISSLYCPLLDKSIYHILPLFSVLCHQSSYVVLYFCMPLLLVYYWYIVIYFVRRPSVTLAT